MSKQNRNWQLSKSGYPEPHGLNIPQKQKPKGAAGSKATRAQSRGPQHDDAQGVGEALPLVSRSET